MSLWTDKTAAEATGGKASGAWQAARVEIDSRRVQPGDLFVALKGERFDGHDFAKDAMAKGAAAMVVSSPSRGEVGRGAHPGNAGVSQAGPHPNPPPTGEGNHIIVADTFKALEDLGRYSRKHKQAKIIGLTGSVGKTSAKEMLRLALAPHGETFASHGNYNNHIGVPLNLANLPKAAKFGVFEMGMNHAGEILALTKLVRPHVAIITNVEGVHLEFFDSVEKIADAKAEIFAGLEPDGVAILNADNPHFARLKKAAGDKRIIACGEAASADCRLLSYLTTEKGCTIEASIFGKKINYTLAAVGKHWALSSLLALAAVHALKLDVEKSARALVAFSEPEGRGRLVRIPVKGGEATLIDDSYNASPASMKAAFAKTAEVAKGRKLAALGDMLELGKETEALHIGLAGPIKSAGFNAIFTAGAHMMALNQALPPAMRGAHAATAMELLPLLQKELKAGDTLLIKGSHGSKMYELAAALMATKEKKHAV